MSFIDLRSDTVTRPTPEMREAMARAEVGDDVFIEDPTVNRLQEMAAAMLGKEAALFVPSGTMGNEICIRLHTQPGQEVVCEERSHVFNAEMAGMAALNGVLARPVRGENGLLDWPAIKAVIRASPAYYLARTGLIALENSHNFAGGAVTSVERMEEICNHAHEAGLPVHLDGARIFNAAAALNRDAAELARPFDSVMFCLSKGLCAPVGSLVVGSREFIERARAVRKMYGGGMRQVGVLAAAGVVALEKMTKRLAEDHANAQLLARGIAGIPGLKIDPEQAHTNIVIFDISDSGLSIDEWLAQLKARGVLAIGISSTELRMVTHHDVSRTDCETAMTAVYEVAATRE
ncbi:MAG: GntG family PLP-dependent aldolase [Blastocatellia bacterium]